MLVSMDATGAAARPGRLLRLAKYDVLEEIGHGGMATVYRAHDPRLGRDVAIKVIHPHLRDSPEVAHRFSVEAKAVAKLHHPNIVEVFDVSAEDEDEQYLVVELLRGLTLRKLVQKHGALPPEVAAALAVDLSNALAHAHTAGVIHRDIKPENVIIEHRRATDGSTGSSSPGERVAVKLTDFGIAKLLDAQGVTSTGQVLGSPAHMAPEQIEGGDVDARADVFGLGVLLYEAMVGHLPFEGSNPAQVLRRVLDGTYPSAEIEQATVGKPWSMILDRALAHDPTARFVDAAEMRDAMLRELTRVGVEQPRGELEAWLDDPDEYAKAHSAKTIERLCVLAGDARKRGDALSAAADYNRALAYAPTDPALLKIVSTMHRADALSRTLKRGAKMVTVTIVLGAAAFFVTRAVRQRIAPDPVLQPASVSRVEIAPPPGPSAAPSVVASSSGQPLASATAPRIVPLKSAGLTGIMKEVRREVTLSIGFPSYGVIASLDGQGEVDVAGSYAFSVDERGHKLHLTCKEDLCIPRDIPIAPGEEPVPVSLSLTIRPATLIVHGDANATYQITSMPQVAVRAETQTIIPMKQKSVRFTVQQLPSGTQQPVELFAGKTGEVTFTR